MIADTVRSEAAGAASDSWKTRTSNNRDYFGTRSRKGSFESLGTELTHLSKPALQATKQIESFLHPDMQAKMVCMQASRVGMGVIICAFAMLAKSIANRIGTVRICPPARQY